jgi:hypothetical protein
MKAVTAGPKRAQPTLKLCEYFCATLKPELFFKTSTNWTPDPKEALDFLLTGSAIEAARALRFKNIEIVQVSDDGKQVFGTKAKTDP